MKKNNFVLVIGSKPNSYIPQKKIKKIYTANAAAERAKKITKLNSNSKLICVAGSKEIEKKEVNKRIFKAKPSKIILRSGNLNIFKNLKKKEIKIFYFSIKKQWLFQKKFFKFGFIILLFAEFFYSNNIFESLLHFLKCVYYKRFIGCSTGFFCMLLALKENPKSQVLISGISMNDGKLFYKKKDPLKAGRAKIDYFLFKMLKNSYKKKIKALDLDLSRRIKVECWNGKRVKI